MSRRVVRPEPRPSPAPIERELKLAAPTDFDLPDLSEAVAGLCAGKPLDQRLQTTCFDTEDLRLARWGCSLRHRVGEGWTLKLPDRVADGVLARRELEFAGEPDAVPAEAVRLVAAYVRGADLRPVASLMTLRRKVVLSDVRDHVVAEVVDDRVTVLDGGPDSAAFRELEIELKEIGDQADAVLAAVRHRLLSAGAGTTEPVSKLVRALGVRACAPAEVYVETLPRSATTADVVRQAIARSVEQLLVHDPGMRLGGDPEDVHQARVATRRLRSDLRTFAPLLDQDRRRQLSAELGWRVSSRSRT